MNALFTPLPSSVIPAQAEIQGLLNVRLDSRLREEGGTIKFMRALALGFLFLLMAAPGRAQSHFTFRSGTGSNATVVVPQSASPTLGGVPLEAGDEIAAVTPAGLVVGAVVWPGAGGGNVSLTVNGDDEVGTPSVVDGIRAGEAIHYRVWDASAGREYSTVSVTYSNAQGFYRTDGLYAANALYALASLAVSVPTAPQAPMLVAPADGAGSIPVSPTLSWNAVPGATGYDVQLAGTADFAAPLLNQSGLTGTSTSASGLAVQTTYHWRVRASNSAGTSAWSAPRSFTTVPAAPQAPALVSPADGATGVDAAVGLAWSASAGASGYDVEVATSETFSPLTASVSGTTTTTFAPAGLASLTRYVWRVRATNAGGAGVWSTPRSFTTAAPQAPSAPALGAPADGATGVALAPTLVWQAAPRAARYSLQVSTRTDFAAPLLVDLPSTTATTAAVTGLAFSTVYYWRVRAANAGGESVWSAPRSFTTMAMQAPQAPTLVAPADGANGVPSRLVLTWAAAEHAAGYDVQVSDFGALAYDGQALPGTSVEVSGLRGQTTFYWRVRARNAAGVGAWSSLRSFTTVSGVAVETTPTGLPGEVLLAAPYPNPSRGRATIRFGLPAAAVVSLRVYDNLGREVAVLVRAASLTPGWHTVPFDAGALPGGRYVTRLQAGKVVRTQPLVLYAPE